MPPFEALDAVARRLERAGIAFALGGSGLMHALGLEDTVRDWDLTTDAAVEVVHEALGDLEPTRHGNLGIHADHKVVCFEGSVEVICRFAFFTPGGVVRIPTLVTGTWRGIPLGSPEAWAVAYLLMKEEKPGREAKAERLFGYARVYPDRNAWRRLDAEPLPDDLRRRLIELPIR